jgi:hypothetical protein
MALVKNPLMSVEARGTTAGITFTKTAAGWVAKAKPHPSASMRGFRPRIRSIIGYLSRQWGELTDGQRQSWRDWASDHPGINKFGDPFIMSGINAYVMLNHGVIRLQGGGTENDLPPEDPPASAVDTLQAVTGVGNAGDVDLTWTELGVGAGGDFWEIQVAGPFQSPGRVEVESRFSYIAITVGAVLLFTVAALDEGFWYWFRVRYTSGEGQVTAWVYAQATPKLTI